LGIDFYVTCVADYSYTFPPFFWGVAGKVTAMTKITHLDTVIWVQLLASFLEAPPLQVFILQCRSHLNMTNVDINGGVVTGIWERLEGVLDEVIENAEEDGT